jgi:hypothetical protein
MSILSQGESTGGQSTISNQQSAIIKQQSAISDQQSAISDQQSASNNPRSSISNHQSHSQSAISDRQSEPRKPRAYSLRGTPAQRSSLRSAQDRESVQSWEVRWGDSQAAPEANLRSPTAEPTSNQRLAISN